MAISYHRPTAIFVDLAVIKENVAHAVLQQQGKRDVFVVVKANGYSHGAVPVAKAAIAAGATGLCVATIDEGIALREAGITQTILILGLVDVQWLPLIIQYHLAIPVATQEWLEKAWSVYQNERLNGQVYLHLAIDTGMGRIGFQENQAVLAAVHWLENHPSFVWEGIFTHFSTADKTDNAYWKKQNERFNTLIATLPRVPRYIHTSNSATTLWREDVGNVVRLGIAMYGHNPSGGLLPMSPTLKPALSLESELVQVKKVPAGAGIGYGKSYETQQSEWIGTVPIGYGDGFVRGMQGFYVLVEGQRCEIIGRVCMDQLMIRLPHSFETGTKVTLIGKNQEEVITIEAIAEHLGTINYEVLCLLAERIPRHYLNATGIFE